MFSAKHQTKNAQQENQHQGENNVWADVTQKVGRTKEAVIEKEELQQDTARQGTLVTDWPTVDNVWQWDFAIRHTKKTRSLQDWKSVDLKKKFWSAELFLQIKANQT
jgi:hypothetical protein